MANEIPDRNSDYRGFLRETLKQVAPQVVVKLAGALGVKSAKPAGDPPADR